MIVRPTVGQTNGLPFVFGSENKKKASTICTDCCLQATIFKRR